MKKHEGWNICDLQPVDYTLRDTWLSSELKKPCAIVDFLYHPQVDFWADHHQTSILTNAEKKISTAEKTNSACYSMPAPDLVLLCFTGIFVGR